MVGELIFDDATENIVIASAIIKTVGIAIAKMDVKTIRVLIFKFLGIACIFSLLLSIITQTKSDL